MLAAFSHCPAGCLSLTPFQAAALPFSRSLCVPNMPSGACRLLGDAFRGWSQAADKLCQQTLANGYEELAGQVGSMKAENDRLRRDNERFVRLIDSGEWGRGRVAELTQAGQLS